MTFVQGDLRDPAFLGAAKSETTQSTAAPPSKIALKDIRIESLNSLHGHVTIILADLFFHQLKEDEQAAVARSLASLLSPEPGSMIFGNHTALPQAGNWSPSPRPGETESKMKMYCHSPETWRKLWEDIFAEDKVEVQVTLSGYGEGTDMRGTFPWNTNPVYELEWSVTRL